MRICWLRSPAKKNTLSAGCVLSRLFTLVAAGAGISITGSKASQSDRASLLTLQCLGEQCLETPVREHSVRESRSCPPASVGSDCHWMILGIQSQPCRSPGSGVRHVVQRIVCGARNRLKEKGYGFASGATVKTAFVVYRHPNGRAFERNQSTMLP